MTPKVVKIPLLLYLKKPMMYFVLSRSRNYSCNIKEGGLPPPSFEYNFFAILRLLRFIINILIQYWLNKIKQQYTALVKTTILSKRKDNND
jgi:hypothetical protein